LSARPRRLLRLLAILALAVAPVAPVLAAADGSHVLVLGRISDNPAAHYEQLKPLLDYVVPKMAGVGIREGRILMARDLQQMESYLRRGRVDWVTETSAGAMLLQAHAGARPLLLTERDGVSEYRTVFFARRDSGVRSLDDLRGRSIAFQNASSTSAYYVPAMLLVERGLPLEILLSPRDRPAPDSVGYVFARSELNVATWVHKRLVDVGALSNLDWNSTQRMPASYRRDLVAIHQTGSFPRGLEMVGAGMAPAVEARLREVLAQAADDPAAREALVGFFGTTRFLPIDAAAQRALDVLRAGTLRVGEVVE